MARLRFPRRRGARPLAAISTIALAVAGCSTTRPLDPGAINHVVVITLADPVEGDALRADCDRLLTAIPEVVSYSCGPHHDIGREGIVDDYTIALTVGFEDEAAYRRYLADERHVELVQRWKPRWTGAVIYDISNAR